MRNAMIQAGSATFAALALIAFVVAFLSFCPALLAAEPLLTVIMCDNTGCPDNGCSQGNGCWAPGPIRVQCIPCCDCAWDENDSDYVCSFDPDEGCI